VRRILIALLIVLGPAGVATADAPTPGSVVEAFRAMYASLSDYQFRIDETSRRGSALEARTMNIYFKKPRFIRMDILKGNRPGDGGSAGVYRNDGRVTARRGGILSFLSATMDKANPQVTSIRGAAIDQIDLAATLEKMRFHLSESACSLAEGSGVLELTFVPRDPSRNDGVTREIIRLDAVTLLPVSAESYEGAELVQRAQWSGYILNAGLPDNLFDVQWDPRQLEKNGIPTLPLN
jgi:outer membrane lipoprotein-sorting protein